MKKLMKRSVALLMMLVMILAATSTTFAATKTKTVAKKDFTTSTSAIEKKATKVKTGTTKLYVKKGQGFIKFVAPKTATYKFTFSKCTSKKRANNGFAEVMKPDASSPKYSFLTDIKTKGGKSNTLWLSVNGAKFTDHDLVDRPLASRTGTMKLKKGAVIYMYLYFGGDPVKTTLVVKKK